MKIAIACDHAGFPLKETILEVVRAGGQEPLDLGAFDTANVDYTDYAEKLGKALQAGEAERGILVCGSGVGASIAHNKMKGIYAGVCHDTYSAHQGVEHDDMNVLCLGARIVGIEVVPELVRAFLGARFSGADRHVRRLNKVLALERAGKRER